MYFQVKWLPIALKFSLSFLSCQVIPLLYKGITIKMCARDAMEVPVPTSVLGFSEQKQFINQREISKAIVLSSHVLSSLICTGAFYQILRKQKFVSSEIFILVCLLFWNLNLPFIINDIPGFQELFRNRLSLMMNY